MANERNPLLVGQIALDLGFLTQERLQECLNLQAAAPSPRPLGEILVGSGALSEPQWRIIRDEQLRRLAESVPYSTSSRDAIFFGRLLVKEGLVSQEVVDQGLRAQQDFAERGMRRRLGEILVEAGHLEEAGVRRALWLQGKELRACTFCGTQYNILVVLAEGFPCKRCAMPLDTRTAGIRADESAYLLPAVQLRPTTVRTAVPTSPDTRARTREGTQTFRRKRASAFRSLLATGVLILAGLAAFIAHRDLEPPAIVAADPEPAEPPLDPVGPEAVPGDPPAVERPRSRLTVELLPPRPGFQGLLGLLTPEGNALAQREVRGGAETRVDFGDLAPGLKRVVFLPRFGALPETREVELPDGVHPVLRLPLRAGVMLEGTVVDHAWKPAAGVKLTYVLPDFMPPCRGRVTSGFLFLGGAGSEGGTFSLSRAGVLRLGVLSDPTGRFSLEVPTKESATLHVGQDADLLEYPGLVPGEPARIQLPVRRRK
jgi:hypothetical protein